MRAVVALFVVGCGGVSKPPAPPPEPTPTPTSTSVAPKPAAAPAEPRPTDPRLAADLDSFDKLWKTVKETFWDPKLGGVDWDAVRAELRPKVLASKSRDETRAILNQALGKLGKSHFGVWGASDADTDAPKGNADVGIDVRIVDGAPVIFRIEAGSAAAASKQVKPGLTILGVDGVDVAPKLAAVAKELGTSTLVPLFQSRRVEIMLHGPEGSPVKLQLTDGKKPFEVALVRKPPAGRMVGLGNLGPEPLIYESRWLDKEKTLGYIRLSIFLDPATVMPDIQKDLAGFAKARGVIIDLRGNPGGIGGMAMGIAGYLVPEDNKKLGTMRTRETSLDFVINPQATRYAGKVAVLIDELSASTSEIFAGGMQALGRGRVFGRRSPGAALPSVIEVLPNGDRFQHAIADYVSTDGKVLEGAGVTPDVVVALDAKALRAGTDPDMVAATRWIKEKP
jgi:carboxyl-terminal processing protease